MMVALGPRLITVFPESAVPEALAFTAARIWLHTLLGAALSSLDVNDQCRTLSTGP